MKCGVRALLSVSVAISVCLVGALRAGEQPDYQKQIKPLLKERCFACHGALKQEANLRLDTAELIRLGGDSGKVVLPGKQAAESLLLERVSAKEIGYRMPPEHEGEPLSSGQMDLLRRWIAAGASGPADEQPEPDPREHWAFRPVIHRSVPNVKSRDWVRNPIDAWVSQRHEEQGLRPQPEASRIELLRRLYMDLIGLPPSAEELDAGMTNPSARWYEETVDRLLEDPRHGERWARHWMDTWRYSDWWGLRDQLRNSQRHLWHWRDWMVESLNDDMPYDQMVRLMLAGDELVPENMAQLRATGFLARNYYIFNRHQWMEQTVEHVSKGFLGLTMNCAKCHDHKFDPIEQSDFYKMRAFFEPYQVRIDLVPGELDVMKDGIPRVFDGLAETPTYLFIRGDESRPDQSRKIAPGVPAVLDFAEIQVEPVTLPATASDPGLRPEIQQTYLLRAQSRLNAARTQFQTAEKRLHQLESESPKPPENNSLPGVSLTDNFSTWNPGTWEEIRGHWKQHDGHLEQFQVAPVSSLLRLKALPPENFEVRLRFRITGGSRWRSVGLSFDGTPLQSNPASPESKQMVYVSGADGDHKIQGAFWQNGRWNYPATARKSASIQLQKDYTLTVRVRETLVNVILNDEPVFAYRLSQPRQPGPIQLLTYDASARFDEFMMNPLSPQTAMQDVTETSGAGAVSSLAAAKHQFRDAELGVREAEAELHWTQAVIAAMQADKNSSATEEAVRAEREWRVAQFRRRLATAEYQLEMAGNDSKKRTEAEKKLQTIRDAGQKDLDLLQAEIKPETSWKRLIGGQWSATRFQHTGHDDPDVKFPPVSTGRRTALARWITDPRNPLTARVAVNHLWGRHLGEPLVTTTFDFGRNGARPTHPELLDWLASEFIDSGWSMKHMHRLIVTSATYRLSSSIVGGESSLAKDPENKGLWRRVPIRLEAEVVRDSLLALAGTLDPTMGGPSIPPEAQAASHRRSLYFFHSNNERNLFLTMFDEASVAECYRREQSIVPQQALALSNSELALTSARQIAVRITRMEPEDRPFIHRAFRLVTGIEPAEQEISASLAALEVWKQLSERNPDQARTNLIWVLINHNDFVTLR